MSRQQQDVDELIDIKNAFYIGNFQQCINEAQKLKASSPEVALEKDSYMYRAYIVQQNYRIVLQELSGSADPLLVPLRCLAEYLSNPGKREAIVADIDARVTKGSELTNNIFVMVAATIYYHEDKLESALRILYGNENLECAVLTLQILLAMNRPDLARRQIKSLQEIDDDATLTQLAQAWLNLVQGGAGLQDAYYTMEEVTERGSGGSGGSGGAAAASAAAAGARAAWPEAEQLLAEAQGRAPRDADLLIGLIANAHHSSKAPEVAGRYLAQLIDSHPQHSFTVDYQSKETEFRRLATQYQPSVQS